MLRSIFLAIAVSLVSTTTILAAPSNPSRVIDGDVIDISGHPL